MTSSRRGAAFAAFAPLVCFALAHVGIFAGLFRGVYSMSSSGTGLYYDYAGRVLHGLLPYRDFVLEYPPLSIVFFTFPRILGESFRWYYVWFQTTVVVCDLVVLAALFLAARWWALSAWRVLTLYTIVVLAVGPITLQQYDLFAAAFALLAAIWFARGRGLGAGVFLGLGIMTKAYPLLLAPLFVLTESKRGRGQLGRAAMACVITCLIVASPWLVLAPKSLGVFIGYHRARGIQIESTYAAIALALHSLFLTTANTVVSFGSWNLTGPIPDSLARASGILLAITLAWSWLVVYRAAARRVDAARDIHFVATAAAFVVTAGLTASKVLSPQYLIWIMPWMPLVSRARERTLIGVFVVVGLLTYCIFPIAYPDLVIRDDAAVALLVVRDVTLVALAVLLGRALRTCGPEARATSSPIAESVGGVRRAR